MVSRVRTMFVIGLLAMAAASGRASPPARNHYYVQIEVIRKAAKALPAADVAGLEKELIADPGEEGPRSAAAGKAHLPVSEDGITDGIAALIRPALKAGHRKDVEAFLKTVSEGHLVRGYQVAEHGGPFVSTLGLNTESAKLSLMLENLDEKTGKSQYRLRSSLAPDQ